MATPRWRRRASGEGGPSRDAAPSQGPDAAAPAIALVPIKASATGQLHMLAWRPSPVAPVTPSKPLPRGQLNLFGVDLEPEPKK